MGGLLTVQRYIYNISKGNFAEYGAFKSNILISARGTFRDTNVVWRLNLVDMC